MKLAASADISSDNTADTTAGAYYDGSKTEESSLQTAVLNSVMACSIDLRRSLLSNIVLTGGNTLFDGFAPRLNQELKKSLSAGGGTMFKSVHVVGNSQQSIY